MQRAEEAVGGLLHLGLVSFRRRVEKERGGYVHLPVDANEVSQVLSFTENYAHRKQGESWFTDDLSLELVITDAGERALRA